VEPQERVPFVGRARHHLTLFVHLALIAAVKDARRRRRLEDDRRKHGERGEHDRFL
jgi:hypothetical protein